MNARINFKEHWRTFKQIQRFAHLGHYLFRFVNAPIRNLELCKRRQPVKLGKSEEHVGTFSEDDVQILGDVHAFDQLMQARLILCRQLSECEKSLPPNVFGLVME